MTIAMREKYLRGIFDAGLIIKGVDGALQMLGAVLLLFLKPETINQVFVSLTQYELLEDPKDKIANFILGFGHLTARSEWFGALFLLSHGLINIFLVLGLLKNKLWCYPLAMVVLSLFGLYQIYLYDFTHSPGLLLLTIVDIVVIALTWHEYHVVKSRMFEGRLQGY